MASGSHSTSGTDGTNGTSDTKKRSRRGIVNMLKLKKARSKGIVQKVGWNELGQPIGKGSTTLSYFIGAYARRHVPITCSNWRKKDLCNIKEALWDEVKQTFHGIEEEHKEKIISRAGTLHLQFRTRLRIYQEMKMVTTLWSLLFCKVQEFEGTCRNCFGFFSD